MTTEELIKELKKLPPKASVWYKHNRILCPIQKVIPDSPVKDWAILTSNEIK